MQSPGQPQFSLVSKVTGTDFIALAIRSMLGDDVLAERGGVPFQTVDLDHVAVKAPQFSFARLKGADPIVRVEMASTGEVATFGRDLHEAYLKSVLAVGMKLPRRRAPESAGGGRYAGARVFLSLGGEKNKWDFLPAARSLQGLGLEILATRLTSAFFTANNVPNQRVYKIHETARPSARSGPRPNILDLLTQGEIDLLVNITDEYASEAVQRRLYDPSRRRGLQRAVVDQSPGGASVRAGPGPLQPGGSACSALGRLRGMTA